MAISTAFLAGGIAMLGAIVSVAETTKHGWDKVPLLASFAVSLAMTTTAAYILAGLFISWVPLAIKREPLSLYRRLFRLHMSLQLVRREAEDNEEAAQKMLAGETEKIRSILKWEAPEHVAEFEQGISRGQIGDVRNGVEFRLQALDIIMKHVAARQP
jgi:hypothetical protein